MTCLSQSVFQPQRQDNSPFIRSQKASFGKRARQKLGIIEVSTGLRIANRLFLEHRYLECFDLYEELAAIHRGHSIELLAELYDLYQCLPKRDERYTLYQARLFDFGIGPNDKVLDVGSGNTPFPLATHLIDLCPADNVYGTTEQPFEHVQGKRVHTCDIEDMRHFADKEFDFVYCSHVLEQVGNPEKACLELMRVGKRGYIESPTRGTDLWLNTAKVSNHLWVVERIHKKLIFTEYSVDEIEGFQCDLLMKMHRSPESKREKALTALLYLKADLVNTMFLWENCFQFEVRRARPTQNATDKVLARLSPVTRPRSVALPAAVKLRDKQRDACSQRRSQQRTCLFLNTYYPRFLQEHYAREAELAEAPYLDQKTSIQARLFGDSDFYSRALTHFGWSAEDLIVNCDPLQKGWARDNCPELLNRSSLEIALEQIRRVRPQVVYLQDLSIATAQFLSLLRSLTELVVGQIASPLPSGTDLAGFDIIISSFPHFVDRFRRQGNTAYYQPLAFEPRVLDTLAPCERELPVTFVGGLSTVHGRGTAFLSRLAELVPVQFWGYGVDSLPRESPIRKSHRGEAWGQDMFSLLQQSRITINRHIDVAEKFANNMRLFEATGCGSLLITDYKPNLGELFEIGGEVVAYRSPEECAALIKYYLAHPDEAEKIAQAGQRRTLRDHTYQKRMEQTAEILERHLRYQAETKLFSLQDTTAISCGHTPIQKSEVTENLVMAWKRAEIPLRQRALVQKELRKMHQGRSPAIFKVLADCLRPVICSGATLLEVGCASGYYYEVLEYLLNKRINFTGVDYSEALVRMASDFYPKAKFQVADGASLPFRENSIQIVVSSGVLLHTPVYKTHIAEAARVAKEHVVAHRTPVCRQNETQYLKKYGYGVAMFELIFSEREILAHFASQGLTLIKQVEYESDPIRDLYGVTYLFKKA